MNDNERIPIDEIKALLNKYVGNEAFISKGSLLHFAIKLAKEVLEIRESKKKDKDIIR